MTKLLASAFLLYLSFPNIIYDKGFSFLIWIFAIPFIIVLEQNKKELHDRMRVAFIFGFISYAMLVNWLFSVNVFGAAAFVFALSVQTIIFCGLYILVDVPKFVRPIAFASLWVLSEFARSTLLGGYTWTIGHALSFNPAFLQPLPILGTYFLAFLIIFVNYTIYQSTKYVYYRKRLLGVAILAIVLVWTYGFVLLKTKGKVSPVQIDQWKIGVIQPNLTPEQKGDQKRFDINVAEHLDLTKRAEIRGEMDLMIWPETAFTDDISRDEEWFHIIRWWTVNNKTPLLMGSAMLKMGKDFNSAVMIKDGEIDEVYDKIHLIPFAETILGRNQFERGNKFGLMNFVNKLGETIVVGVSICSEDGYPRLFQELAKRSNLLVVMLNDGWFKQKAALMMHAQSSIFRAVENRRNVIRSANTGFSVAIDPFGRLIQSIEPKKADFAIFKLPRPTNIRSIFSWGELRDFFTYLVSIFVIILMFRRRFKKVE